MAKPEHYIKILETCKEWAEKCYQIDLNWQQTIFDDITENGTKLTKLILPDDFNGRPVVGLCGEIFFCKAGKDSYRDDALVVFNVDSANKKLPDSIPEPYAGNFSLIGQSERPATNLDDVGHLFPPPPKPIKVSLGRVSPELKKVLALSGSEIRKNWLPQDKQATQLTPDRHLSLLTSIWRQFDLEQYTLPSFRQRGILNGTIKATVRADELEEYVQLFNLSMLNSYVMGGKQGDGASGSGFHKLLERIVDLPLSPFVRSQVWSAMAGNTDPISIRKEIKNIVSAVRGRDMGAVNEWVEAAMSACKSVALNARDRLLIEKIEDISSETDPVPAFFEWVDSIEVEDRIPDADADKELSVQDAEESVATDADIVSVDAAPVEDGRDIPNDGSISSRQAHQAAPATTVSKEPMQKRAEQWVIQQRAPDLPEFMASLYDEANATMLTMKRLSERGYSSIASLQETIEHISALQQKFQDGMNRMPDTKTLKEDCLRAQKILQRAQVSIGDAVLNLIDAGTPLGDVEEIAVILEKRSLLQALPGWVWAAPEGGRPEDGDGRVYADELADPIVRRRISVIMEICSDLTPSLYDVLGRIPPASKEGDEQLFLQTIKDRFGSAVKQLDKLLNADEKDRAWIEADLKAGFAENKILSHIDRLDSLKSQLSAATFEQVAEKIRSASEHDAREAALFCLEKAVQFVAEQFGSADTASADQIATWIDRKGSLLLEQRSAEKELPIELTLDHNLVDHPRRRLHISYLPYPNAVGDYGYFTAPVMLKANARPSNLDLRLSYEVNSSLTKAWPSEWEQPGPKNLQISSDKWRKDASGFIYTFQIIIPVRRPKSIREPVEVLLSISMRDTGKSIEVNGRLVWEHWDTTPWQTEGVSLMWPDGIETAYVTRHPIGPQEHLEYIKNRVLGGSSFAIVAPRRFGKTTLAVYLKELGGKWGLVVPDPIVCTEIDSNEQGINFRNIWERVSNDLNSLVGSSLKPTKEDVPGIDAFDFVRKAAKDRGKKGILLVFDEAQLFFPRDGGPQLGNVIKDRLEREWSRRDMTDRVPLYFGFIGLPDISEKMGANLQGLLMPQHATKISQNKLNQLVYTFTGKSLHTSREARDELTRKSGNLYMLKILLRDLVSYVNERSRNWIIYDDVVEIINELKGSLAKGERPEIDQYLRDVFNQAEDVNIWNPRPCFPTAVALARAASEKQLRIEKCVPEVVETLNRWCMEAGYDGANRLVYTDQRVQEHVKMLEELNVIQQHMGFQSDILEAWLLGRWRNFTHYSRNREALFAGALRRIRLPEARDSIQKGSQAEIYKFFENQENYALRLMMLSTFENQKRFHETIGLLEKLKSRSFQDKPGAEYLYRLKDIGIADSPVTSGSKEIAGVEIYNWVDGISLEEKIGQLSPPVVALLGAKLAQAVCLIHRHRILHRDICPRNIILKDGTDSPVLIDFGLARLSTDEMKTIISSKYTAPEISGKHPKWSDASDIYSLGATLYNLLTEQDKKDGALIKILSSCMHEQPKDRPNADDLLKKMNDLLPQLHVTEQKNAASKKLESITKIDIDGNEKNAWFSKVIREKIDAIFKTVCFGLHDDVFSRCTEAAQILDFTLEGYPEEQLKLTLAFNKDSKKFGDQLKGHRCIEFLGALRIGRNHYDYKLTKEKTLKRFKEPTSRQMEEWVIDGASRIGNVLGLQSLESLVQAVINYDHNNK